MPFQFQDQGTLFDEAGRLLGWCRLYYVLEGLKMLKLVKPTVFADVRISVGRHMTKSDGTPSALMYNDGPLEEFGAEINIIPALPKKMLAQVKHVKRKFLGKLESAWGENVGGKTQKAVETTWENEGWKMYQEGISILTAL